MFRKLQYLVVSVMLLAVALAPASQWQSLPSQPAEHLGLPRLLLCQNAPNPFRTATSIRYQLPSPGNVSIRVLDVSGRLIRELTKEEQQAGEHVVRWDGRDARGRLVPPGVYFYRLQTAVGSDTRRSVLVR
jgi:hypothetical protein